MSDYLTQEGIQEITGYKIPSKQIQQLTRLGTTHIIRPDGYPRVLKAERGRVMMEHHGILIWCRPSMYWEIWLRAVR